MKRIKHLLFTFILQSTLHGQDINDSIVGALYNETVSSFFSDTSSKQEQEKYGCIILKTEFDTNKIVRSVGPIQFKFVNSRSSMNSLLTKPDGENFRHIYTLNHKFTGPDSIFIFITISAISDSSPYAGFVYQVVSVAGDYAIAKFIYNRNDKIWRLINKEEIKSINREKRK